MATRFLIVLGIWLSFAAIAEPRDLYTFSSPAAQQQFQGLIEELRCLVCQNQNLAGSNAPLAADLRHEVYLKVQAGQSNAEIKDYLLARYGQFVLFKPVVNAQTLALWVIPFVLLVGIFVGMWRFLRRS
ncbi:MAG: cytochrome c-type biogenesis protein CcmH [Gammaproteobacteria bacterium]